jgi:hypothetical protein
MSWRRKQTDKKKKIYGPRLYDSSCKNSGSCPWCRSNRTIVDQKLKQKIKDEI